MSDKSKFEQMLEKLVADDRTAAEMAKNYDSYYKTFKVYHLTDSIFDLDDDDYDIFGDDDDFY